jgi:voltage-gated potassium channel Kch
LTSIAWCFFISGLAEIAGLSKEMGSLIAGMSIAAFPYGADVIAKLTGIRDFFVTLFFVSLGLKVPVPTWQLLKISLVVAAFVLGSRLLSVAPTAYFLRMGLRNGLLTALNLAQMSEFSLVIMALGANYGHVSEGLSSTVLASMLVTSILATYIIKFNDTLTRALMRAVHILNVQERGVREEKTRHRESPKRDIVLLGCFRAGMAFLDAVETRASHLKERVLVVDFNAALKDPLEARGFHWVYGDIAYPETLHHWRVVDASFIICSISDTFLKGITNRRLLAHLKRMAPQSQIIMTAEENQEANILLQEGAKHVIVSEKLSGIRIFELVTENLDQSDA